MFREPKPGYAEMMELVEKLNPDYPTIAAVENAIRALFDKHRDAFRAELEEMGVEYDKNLDLWKGLYNYSHAEYRDSNGHFLKENEAKKKEAKIWIWREDNPSMPQVKEDSQKAEFRDPQHPAYRFYRPAHPFTKKPCTPPKTGWRWPLHPYGNQTLCFSKLAEDDRIVWGTDENKIPQTKKFVHEVETNVAKSVIHDYTDGEKELTDLFGKSRTFPNPKPTTLISRFVLQTSNEAEWVLDFFAGSGTTGHATANAHHVDGQRRKLLLIEGGEHFETTLLPRIKRVHAAKQWRGGKPTQLDGIGLFAKVCTIEQYEEAVAGAVYQEETGDLFRNTKTDPYSQYVFFRDMKMARALELDYENDEVNVQLDRLYPDIDLAETLSCVTGKWIKRVTADEVEFADGSKQSLAKPDWRLLKPLIFWGPIV